MGPENPDIAEIATTDLEVWIFGKKTNDPLREAFPSKRVIHPSMGGARISVDEWQNRWKEILTTTNTEPEKRVAYIHIPFCQSRCLFCGFYQNNSRTGLEDSYIDHLVEELSEAKTSDFMRQRPLTAVYFGGGTPSSLSVKNIERLLKALRTNLFLANDCEITFESRLYDFDNDKVAACIDGGINRFSLGIQSFDTKTRNTLGRILSREDVLDRLAYFVDLDQAVIAIDLIYGLPGQSLEIWEHDLATVADRKIEGVSIYQLNVFEGGKLDNKLGKGKIPAAATTAEQATYFKRSMELMDKYRYRQISTTHWARSTRERNIYNTTTKRGSCLTLPFGAGSGGSVAGHGVMLDRDLKSYLAKVKRGEKPIAFMMKKAEDSSLYADIAAQFALGRLDLEFFKAKYDIDLNRAMKQVFQSWLEIGLIELSDSLLVLTQAGQFWYVNLTQAMIDWMEKQKKGDPLHVEIDKIAAQG